MVTITKYLTHEDLKNKICDCKEEDKLKILFREVCESEIRVQPEQGLKGAHILRNDKIVACCEFCKKVYFIMTTFEGGFTSQYVSVDSIELFDGSMKELRSIINNMYDEYEHEIINMATDDYSVKVLDKYEDDEKTMTTYAYLNREDKALYEDLIN
ncbi:MAG: hypothetical protein RSG52_08800 [Terrisporobacter sp.]|uniref:hypothetical protein n=1 Tax=Terrisporobacter sp. TaxID=1965305 RepID=UPI002FC70CD4